MIQTIINNSLNLVRVTGYFWVLLLGIILIMPAIAIFIVMKNLVDSILLLQFAKLPVIYNFKRAFNGLNPYNIL
jgi:hypothetical protein